METVEYEINVDVPDYAVCCVEIWCSKMRDKFNLILYKYKKLGSIYEHSFNYKFNGNKLCISLVDSADAIDKHSRLIADALNKIIKYAKDPIADLKERIFERVNNL